MSTVISPYILKHSDALQYMMAGKSTFTIKNEVSGNRFTYKVNRKKPVGGIEQNVWFVSVLYNPNNESDYKYIGTIFKDSAEEPPVFRHTSKSKVSREAQSFQTFEYVFTHLMNKSLKSIVNIYRSNRCGRCGKKLTVPESIMNGLGPDCAGKAYQLSFSLGING
jgi:hypothetical protein